MREILGQTPAGRRAVAISQNDTELIEARYVTAGERIRPIGDADPFEVRFVAYISGKVELEGSSALSPNMSRTLRLSATTLVERVR